ncbi:MAG: hypothetical protein H6714_07105 [Myxococcales bacterium]|nr:hypothetical protein [Myxococcales bacterium]
MQASTFKRILLLGFYFGVGLCATCERSNSGEGASAPLVASAKPNAEKAFELHAKTEERYAPNTWQVFNVTVDVKGSWHLNRDFPTELNFVDLPTAVKLRKPTLSGKDAVTFTEPQLRFEVPFMASPGKHAVKAELAFAVCTAQSCVPEHRTVELSLNVTD